MRKTAAIVALLAVTAAIVVAVHVTGWLMQESGWNCMMRKVGYEQGFGEPPEQSSYCKKEPKP